MTPLFDRLLRLCTLTSAAFLATAIVLGACSSGGSGAQPAASGGNGGSSGSTTVGSGGAQCFEGHSCICSDGRDGKTTCSGGVEQCSCDGCPSFSLGTPPSWTPCGGEPFGRWHETTADSSVLKLDFFLGARSGTCGVRATKPPSQEFRLEIEDGGSAHFVHGFREVAFDVLDSCIRSVVDTSCDNSAASWSCKLGDCGICSCAWTQSQPSTLSGTWTRSGTSLHITVKGLVDTTFDYCVSGNSMTLRDSSGLIVSLERAGVAGAPVPCDQRTVEQCKLGSGCRVGACVGLPTCASATTETDCNTHQGCSWAPNQCGGTASACTLADYGVVPGCSFTGAFRCTGTATACALKKRQQCTAPGCEAVDGCIGGAVDCGRYGSSTFCESVTGCSWNASGGCVGNATCEQQVFSCSSIPECTPTECRGTPTPCQNLNELTCEQTPGCQLEAPPP